MAAAIPFDVLAKALMAGLSWNSSSYNNKQTTHSYTHTRLRAEINSGCKRIEKPSISALTQLFLRRRRSCLPKRPNSTNYVILVDLLWSWYLLYFYGFFFGPIRWRRWFGLFAVVIIIRKSGGRCRCRIRDETANQPIE